MGYKAKQRLLVKQNHMIHPYENCIRIVQVQYDSIFFSIAYDYSSEIASSSKAKAAIQAAIADYQKYTCLRFLKRTSESEYLHFYKGGGCSSPVGRTGGRNTISLASGCWSKSTVIHEMGHSLGEYNDSFLMGDMCMKSEEGSCMNSKSKNIVL